MNKVQITFKSGAQIEFDCQELAFGTNAFGLVKITWETGVGRRVLRYIDPDSVAAIVETRD